jgi:outer membrane lipoprotein LolB
MKRRLALGLMLMWLASCSHTPPRQASLPLADLDAWQMRGRIAVARGKEGFNGRFVWHQDLGTMLLRIRGPLGVGGIEVSGAPGRYTVLHRGETLSLDDPETELSALVGWWLPVNSLSAWLRALPDENFPFEAERDAEGQLVRLEQRGWRAEYPSYRQREAHLLPERILLNNGEVRVRVVVDKFDAETR